MDLCGFCDRSALPSRAVKSVGSTVGGHNKFTVCQQKNATDNGENLLPNVLTLWSFWIFFSVVLVK